MKGFGSSSICKIVEILTVPICIHGQVFESEEFQVLAKTESNAIPIILAENFLIRNKLCINMMRQRLTRQFDDGSTWEYYLPQKCSACKTIFRDIPCFAETGSSISTGEIRTIEVKWTFPGNHGNYKCANCTGPPEEMDFFVEEVDQQTEEVSQVRFLVG